MKTGTTIIVWMFLAMTPFSIYAQVEPGNDNPGFNINLGLTTSAPLNPMARYTSIGFGLDIGGGYNFDRHNAVIGEFMWNWLNATDRALQPVRAAAQSSTITGYGDVYAFTANYRFELRGRKFGTYFIGGGGWYNRGTSLSRAIPTGTTISCDPAWLWWGYTCSSGTVNTTQTFRNHGTSAFGANGGIGFTIRVGEAPYRFYVEPRYHYAPTKSINTQLIAITVGIRY
jgi:hypothetical protein